MAELDKRAEDVLRSNIEILYSQLDSSIQDFFKYGYHKREIRYINAYLSATLNAIISYVERLIKVGCMSETETVLALKFANNLQKHEAQLISISKPEGGFTLPFSLEGGFSIPKIEVLWDDCIGLSTEYTSQREAYEKLLKKKPIIETLEPIVRELLNGEK